MSDKINLNKAYKDLTQSDRQAAYSKVVMKVDDSTTYTAGNDTGATLYVENAYGTQAAANQILSQISGYRYQPYEASGAILDIAAEIGDGLSVGNIYSGIFNRTTTYGRISASNISAPTDGEVEHEYPQANTNKYATYAGLKNGTTEVNGSGITAGSIGSSQLGSNSVGTSQLINGSVDSNILASNSVGTSQLISDSVTNDIIATDAVNEDSVLAGCLSTLSLSSGVNTSLGYANYSNNVFNSNLYTVSYLYAQRGGFLTSLTLFGHGTKWITKSVKNASGVTISITYLGREEDT